MTEAQAQELQQSQSEAARLYTESAEREKLRSMLPKDSSGRVIENWCDRMPPP
jgi:hypothetical protein